MYLFHSTREMLIEFLPKNGHLAEIGTAEGDFADHILKTAQPSHLHLIDPWEHQAVDQYKTDSNNVTQEEADRRYESVCNRFKDETDKGVVTIHRNYSTEAVKYFGDQQFDWIYVDGMHTEQAVAEDLRCFAPKVKPGGFICGHDYTNHAAAQRMKFGVIEAVNTFVRETSFEFIALTLEPFPTYVLSAEPNSALCKEFLTYATHGLDIALAIDGFEDKNFSQTMAEFSDGKRKLISKLS
ncbi:MAG: class I SAM-dependent methyltransferase [Rhodospirillales bacterium]